MDLYPWRSRRRIGGVMGTIRRQARQYLEGSSELPLAVTVMGATHELLTVDPPAPAAWMQYLDRLGQDFAQLAGGPLAELPLEGTLRFDQVAALRRWGIAPAGREADDESVFREYLRRFAQRSRESARILFLRPGWDQLYLPGLLADDLEALMLDVLNEHEPVARHATLVEDFLEKTDLRVRFPVLERRRGARVQVSWSATPESQLQKSGAFARREEYLFLSPWELAKASDRYPDPSTWAGAFRRALEARQQDVRGPMALLPEPMREEIRSYVRRQAIETTRLLRAREAATGPIPQRKKRRKWTGGRS